ncbi:MAG: ATP-binding cassette domain-containing protein [Methanobrevibacter sp.]|nr:ATP-binding cassette domain-containing protein [Methanobrevibacter sp.]
MEIELKNISKQFKTSSKDSEKIVQALDDVSFKIKEGEVFGFVGANGAGKSTTMRIIMGVLNPDSGSILVNGEKINRNDRQKMGYMPSERGLYPKMKVYEQIKFLTEIHGLSSKDAKKQTNFWLKKLDITQHKDKLLQTLSTGNQQKAQLVATLAPKPEVLILDEPFRGLDPIAVKVMVNTIKDFANENKPVLFSSHQLELIDKLADKVSIIKDGKIIINGTPKQLREKANVSQTKTIPTPLSDIFGDLINFN